MLRVTLLLLMILSLSNIYAQSESLPVEIHSLAWSPDGDLIAVGGRGDLYDFSVRIVSADTGEVVTSLIGSEGTVVSIDWSPDSSKIAAASIDDLGFRIWDVQTGEIISSPLFGSQSGRSSISWNSEGSQVAVASGSSEGIAIHDALTGEITDSIFGGTYADWSPDGTKLAAGSGHDGKIYVSTLSPLSTIYILDEHSAFSTLEWSPDSTKFASGGGFEDHTVRIWDGDTGEQLLLISDHTDTVGDVSWHPDGTLLATASTDGTVRIWDTSTGENLDTFSTQSPMYSVDWSPDGTRLVYGGLDSQNTFKIVSYPTDGSDGLR